MFSMYVSTFPQKLQKEREIFYFAYYISLTHQFIIAVKDNQLLCAATVL